MAVPSGSIDIWNFVDKTTGVTVRKWLRDSWARRKIVALQQAIAAIVVPTASTANPQMDGTAAPGSSTDYARADHVHPSDTSKQDVGKFAVVTGTLPSSATWSAYSAFPTGFSLTNCVMISFEVLYSASANQWRMGEGSFNTSFSRAFCQMDANGIKATTTASAIYGADFRVVLMRTDI